MLKKDSSPSLAVTPYPTVRSNVDLLCRPHPVLSCLPGRLVCDCSRHTLHEAAHHSALLHHYWVQLGWLSARCVCTQQHGRPPSEPIFLLSSHLLSSHLTSLITTVSLAARLAHAHHCPSVHRYCCIALAGVCSCSPLRARTLTRLSLPSSWFRFPLHCTGVLPLRLEPSSPIDHPHYPTRPDTLAHQRFLRSSIPWYWTFRLDSFSPTRTTPDQVQSLLLSMRLK